MGEVTRTPRMYLRFWILVWTTFVVDSLVISRPHHEHRVIREQLAHKFEELDTDAIENYMQTEEISSYERQYPIRLFLHSHPELSVQEGTPPKIEGDGLFESPTFPDFMVYLINEDSAENAYLLYYVTQLVNGKTLHETTSGQQRYLAAQALFCEFDLVEINIDPSAKQSIADMCKENKFPLKEITDIKQIFDKNLSDSYGRYILRAERRLMVVSDHFDMLTSPAKLLVTYLQNTYGNIFSDEFPLKRKFGNWLMKSPEAKILSMQSAGTSEATAMIRNSKKSFGKRTTAKKQAAKLDVTDPNTFLSNPMLVDLVAFSNNRGTQAVYFYSRLACISTNVGNLAQLREALCAVHNPWKGQYTCIAADICAGGHKIGSSQVQNCVKATLDHFRSNTNLLAEIAAWKKSVKKRSYAVMATLLEEFGIFVL